MAALREGFAALWQKAASGDNNEERLLRDDSVSLYVSNWSRVGRFIIYTKQDKKTGLDISVLPLFGDRQPQNYQATIFAEAGGKVSPDGRWMAFLTDESGRTEVYVQSFPAPGRKVKISQGGGNSPRWRSDGKELYYVSADDKLMAVPVEVGASFNAGTPVALFEMGNFGRRISR